MSYHVRSAITVTASIVHAGFVATFLKISSVALKKAGVQKCKIDKIQVSKYAELRKCKFAKS